MLGLLDLPVEIRFMIYRLLFCPSPEPILLSLLPVSSAKHSAQLLRTCRACHEEGSPILYGENKLALDWAYRGTEEGILDFFAAIGLNNRQLIRHLRVREGSIGTLKLVGGRRDLRPVLENLESLSLELYKYGPLFFLGADLLRAIPRWLRKQRGPYRKLVRAFITPGQHATRHLCRSCVLSIRLISARMEPGPEVLRPPPCFVLLFLN